MKYKFVRNMKTGERFAINNINGTRISEKENGTEYKKALATRKAYLRKKERESVFECVGLTKCKTETGRIFWE